MEQPQTPPSPKQVTLKPLERKEYPAWGFRPGVPCFPMRMNFIFLNGGMGDYICWMKAITWLAECATWLDGTLVGPVYFRELAEYFLKPYPRWKYIEYVNIPVIGPDSEVPFRGPVELPRESLNATGAHLLTCGWVYYTNKERAPQGWEGYVRFKQEDLDACLRERDDYKLPTDYAVITCGTTTPSREIPGHYWNHIIEHVLARGLTPVFLGKTVTETGNPRNIHTKFDQRIQIGAGLDLRERTSLFEAAAVISRARVVIGHDNGLLHLAGCTSAPIVFGYNLALPEHRRPIRPWLLDNDRCYDVVLEPGELACYGCQSKTNFVLGFNFRQCFYGDNLCLTKLFDDNGRRWKEQIDRAIEECSQTTLEGT